MQTTTTTKNSHERRVWRKQKDACNQIAQNNRDIIGAKQIVNSAAKKFAIVVTYVHARTHARTHTRARNVTISSKVFGVKCKYRRLNTHWQVLPPEREREQSK